MPKLTIDFGWGRGFHCLIMLNGRPYQHYIDQQLFYLINSVTSATWSGRLFLFSSLNRVTFPLWYLLNILFIYGIQFSERSTCVFNIKAHWSPFYWIAVNWLFGVLLCFVFFLIRHITKFWLDYDLAYHNSDGQGRQCVYLIIFSWWPVKFVQIAWFYWDVTKESSWGTHI